MAIYSRGRRIGALKTHALKKETPIDNEKAADVTVGPQFPRIFCYLGPTTIRIQHGIPPTSMSTRSPLYHVKIARRQWLLPHSQRQGLHPQPRRQWSII
ncbi:hypothetical protein MRB53_028554 [Persea americana]|uniref:Uncharacterized protein n=1 Tax=Persea americana TaxID=3435 RepID=A0ACC2KFT7_PERAE|nr:hypothetical protein MRB53_028554 [Persea americana]